MTDIRLMRTYENSADPDHSERMNVRACWTRAYNAAVANLPRNVAGELRRKPGTDPYISARRTWESHVERKADEAVTAKYGSQALQIVGRA